MFIYMIQTRFLRIKQSSASGMKKNLVVIPKKWKKKQVIELEKVLSFQKKQGSEVHRSIVSQTDTYIKYYGHIDI